MNARNAILDKLSHASKMRKDAGDTIPARPDFSVMHRDIIDPDQLSDQFEAMISNVKGEVIRTSEANLIGCLQVLLQDKRINTLLLSPTSVFKESLVSSVGKIQLYDKAIEGWKEELFNDMDAAITSTLGGIAETGTLVLWPSVEEPRLMSLVPPIHIAILYKKEIQPTFWHFMQHHQWSQGMPTNALLISGPSKTADIEQTLAYGVHGPKELIVLLVE